MPTFQLKRVVPAKHNLAPYDVAKHVLHQNIVTKNDADLLTYTAPDYPMSASFGNGFIGTIFDAYSNHYHLVLRPDDVWLQIAITFANYVDKHAEEMRSLFVEHDGKKKLRVTEPSSIYTVSWDNMIAKFSQAIKDNTRNDIREWLEPDFSTTTAKDRLIGSVVLMAAMKNYFEYYGSCCSCGLPSITLEGTLADWQKIRRRFDQIAIYGSNSQPDLLKWHQILVPVLDKFIETYQGNVDQDFWQRIVNYDGGSGTSDVSGWILAFIPFDEGKYRLNNPVDIASTAEYGLVDTYELKNCSTVEVPVKISDETCGGEYDTIFYAGALVGQYHPASNSIEPSFDWVMLDVTKDRPRDLHALVQYNKPQYDAKHIYQTLSESTKHTGPAEYNNPDIHQHVLKYTSYLYDHRCDVCKMEALRESYRCQQCDFDYCLVCFHEKTSK